MHDRISSLSPRAGGVGADNTSLRAPLVAPERAIDKKLDAQLETYIFV